MGVHERVVCRRWWHRRLASTGPFLVLLWVISSGEGGTTNASKLGKRDGKRDALARTPPPPPPPPPRRVKEEDSRDGRPAGRTRRRRTAGRRTAPRPLTASSALWFDSIDGSMRQFDAGVPRPNTFYFGCGTSARPG
jgi:hypothetical protein